MSENRYDDAPDRHLSLKPVSALLASVDDAGQRRWRRWWFSARGSRCRPLSLSAALLNRAPRALVQKPLVQAVAADRFDLHPLLAQYLRELLGEMDWHVARKRHRIHTLAWAEAELPRLLGEEQVSVLAGMHNEQSQPPCRLAGRHGAARLCSNTHGHGRAFRYWTRQNHFQAGVEFFRTAADALTETEPGLAASLRLRALGCIHWEGYQQSHLLDALRDLAVVRANGSRSDQAMALLLAGRCATYLAASAGGFERDLLIEGQALFQEMQNEEGLTEIAILFGFHEQQLANHGTSRRWYRQAADALRSRGDRQRLAFVLFRHAVWPSWPIPSTRPMRWRRESLALHTQLGDQRGVLHSQVTLGLVAFQRGQLDEAAAVLC